MLGMKRLSQRKKAKRPSPYGVSYVTHNLPSRIGAGRILGGHVSIKNCGTMTWMRHHPDGRQVNLIVFSDDQLLLTQDLPCDQVIPGQQVDIYFSWKAPETIGTHELLMDMVQQNVTRFSQQGAEPLRMPLRVDPETKTISDLAYEKSSRINPWFYQPTGGVGKSLEGEAFPRFVSKAKACHVWDLEGRRYVDYVMGWGCYLLGYADDRIQRALEDVLHSAGVTPLPHVLEMEVAEMLTQDFPCAEMVAFGKNGSDVCTLSARLARLFTGKQHILCCGYHGWQDFWAEQSGFSSCGIPDRAEPLVHGFAFNQKESFLDLFDRYKDNLAAVMIEPSGPIEDIQGPRQDADPGFLAGLSRKAESAGALLIFDEIVTGYRYPSGSVQEATGIVPDLTCLGKAVASGMPLSALVGRAKIFQSCMGRAHYGPTFKSEVYSFAVARKAIEIYRRQPVAQQIWDYGTRLMEGINGICNRLSLSARCSGPPFRMSVRFDEPDAFRLRLKQALYQQELLKAGIITYKGVMIPSSAHTEEVLQYTLKGVEKALMRVAEADESDTFHQYLEIPP